MKVIKRIHRGYKEMTGLDFKNPLGKYQYLYSSSKGKISLVELKNHFMDGQDIWEIMSLRVELFEDVERFKSQKEAVIKISQYLM